MVLDYWYKKDKAKMSKENKKTGKNYWAANDVKDSGMI